jgi:hypothetical protein
MTTIGLALVLVLLLVLVLVTATEIPLLCANEPCDVMRCDVNCALGRPNEPFAL